MSGFRLPRLPRDVAIIGSNGKPTLDFQRWWQSVMKELEAQESAQDAAIEAIEAAQAAADAANAAAEAAQTAADTAATAAGEAQTAADTANTATETIATEGAINNSYVDGATISATDAGSDAAVTISAHDRYYGDGSSVAVTGGSITGLAYSTSYFVYYDQPSRAGGVVTYLVTTDSGVAVQSGDRHVVGAVVTPAALGTPIAGGIVLPPGAAYIRDVF